MTKIITLLLLGFLCMNFQTVLADDKKLPANNTNNSQNAVDENFNFEDNSYYITEEQLQQVKDETSKIDDNAGFEARIINSSHFSSGTATKTWIPLNKAQ